MEARCAIAIDPLVGVQGPDGFKRRPKRRNFAGTAGAINLLCVGSCQDDGARVERWRVGRAHEPDRRGATTTKINRGAGRRLSCPQDGHATLTPNRGICRVKRGDQVGQTEIDRPGANPGIHVSAIGYLDACFS